MKISRSDEGTVTNHAIIPEAYMTSHTSDSKKSDSEKLAEMGKAAIIGGGYFGDTSALENIDLHAEQMFLYLLRIKTNQIIKIDKSDFNIGKEKLRVNYYIEDNIGISKLHASIIIHGKKCFVIDHNSKNHTYVNQIIVPPQTEIKLVDGDIIRLANEEFIFSEGRQLDLAEIKWNVMLRQCLLRCIAGIDMLRNELWHGKLKEYNIRSSQLAFQQIRQRFRYL